MVVVVSCQEIIEISKYQLRQDLTHLLFISKIVSKLIIQFQSYFPYISLPALGSKGFSVLAV